MTTITVPHPDDPGYDERHGPSQWSLTLSDARYVWEKAGMDLRTFAGRRSGDCAEDVRELIVTILDSPDKFIGAVTYYDLRATVAALTGVFFTLRERRDAPGNPRERAGLIMNWHQWHWWLLPASIAAGLAWSFILMCVIPPAGALPGRTNRSLSRTANTIPAMPLTTWAGRVKYQPGHPDVYPWGP